MTCSGNNIADLASAKAKESKRGSGAIPYRSHASMLQQPCDALHHHFLAFL